MADYLDKLREALAHGCVISTVDLTGRAFDGPHTDTIRALLAERDALREALQAVRDRIGEMSYWWIDDPKRGGFDVDKIDAALTPKETP